MTTNYSTDEDAALYCQPRNIGVLESEYEAGRQSGNDGVQTGGDSQGSNVDEAVTPVANAVSGLGGSSNNVVQSDGNSKDPIGGEVDKDQ